MRIALAGNPNSGKTTMYNALTGANEKVGNWAGVTVDKKEHAVKKSLSGKQNMVAVDLPGAYSMSPFTSEESITRDYIKNESPDVIINIVDATNLSRSLFFTTQLSELGIPMVVALNKTDMNNKKRNKIDIKKLSEKLGLPVIATTSTTGKGLDKVIAALQDAAEKTHTATFIQTDIDFTSKDDVEKADRQRFEFVNEIVAMVETRKTHINDLGLQDKIDGILTNKWLGLPIFAAVMYFVFWVSQSGPGVWISEYLTDILEKGQAALGTLFEGAHPLVHALFIDGVIGGVIAVLGFLPLVMVMYFLIALLEDCGYMARATVVLDPIFKRVGLSGKSVIPFVIATGCAVPGVMASRTIRNERERRAAAMLAPFMPCGAKLPVIALFAGAFFENASWVGALMYFVGIVIIFFAALIVNRIAGHRPKKLYFIIELPEYKVPSLYRAFLSMCERGKSYIIKATTVILLCNTAVQVMQSFSWSFEVAASAEQSILASISGPFSYILVPIAGVVSWQLAAASITGFIAKENVVGTLAVCLVGLGNLENVGLTTVAALAYLMFNLFTPPCFAAIAAMSAEMKSGKWLFGALGLQFAVGYSVSFLVYQIGTLITEGTFGAAFIPGLVAFLAIIAIIAFMCINAEEKLKAAAK